MQPETREPEYTEPSFRRPHGEPVFADMVDDALDVDFEQPRTNTMVVDSLPEGDFDLVRQAFPNRPRPYGCY